MIALMAPRLGSANLANFSGTSSKEMRCDQADGVGYEFLEIVVGEAGDFASAARMWKSRFQMTSEPYLR